MEYSFFAHLECAQFKGAIGGQAFRGCLIESHVPMLKCAKIKEAASHTLKCLWCANRVTKYDCDIAHQSIVHQPFFTRCQKVRILRCQTKERKRMIAIGVSQF